jgi:hypothetical protein
MPRSETEQAAWEQQCYGCSGAAAVPMVFDSKTEAANRAAAMNQMATAPATAGVHHVRAGCAVAESHRTAMEIPK